MTELRAGHRFLSGSTTSALSLAIKRGDADGALALLDADDPEVHWIRPEDTRAHGRTPSRVIDAAREIVLAGLAGQDRTALDAAERVKVLAAVRHGPNGLFEWSDAISNGVLGTRCRWPSGRDGRGSGCRSWSRPTIPSTDS